MKATCDDEMQTFQAAALGGRVLRMGRGDSESEARFRDQESQDVKEPNFHKTSHFSQNIANIYKHITSYNILHVFVR